MLKMTKIELKLIPDHANNNNDNNNNNNNLLYF